MFFSGGAFRRISVQVEVLVLCESPSGLPAAYYSGTSTASSLAYLVDL